MDLHPGRLGDVWKHLLLAELVRAEAPTRYGETHAGAATSAVVDDPERRYGVRHCAVAFGRPCAYLDVVRPFLLAGRYPGSATVALSVRPDVDALLADTDPAAVADLRSHGARHGWTATRAVTADGMAALRPWLAEGRALVHVDPFDPWASEHGSSSALAFAADAVAAGHLVAFWYGYDDPDERDWAIDELGHPDLWAGDVLVTTAAGTVEEDGELDLATTPGTGFGVVVAGAGRGTLRRLEQLGEALVQAYAGAPLPDGRPGALDLLVDVS